jgi:hypothetical protein
MDVGYILPSIYAPTLSIADVAIPQPDACFGAALQPSVRSDAASAWLPRRGGPSIRRRHEASAPGKSIGFLGRPSIFVQALALTSATRRRLRRRWCRHASPSEKIGPVASAGRALTAGTTGWCSVPARERHSGWHSVRECERRYLCGGSPSLLRRVAHACMANGPGRAARLLQSCLEQGLCEACARRGM